jgi:SSS family solute:Na+ symporter
MHPIDWLIVVAYCLMALGIGLLLARRAGKSMADFLLSGRSLPWWLAGTSMVATTFAADTPLAITGIVRTRGIAGNWFWWNLVMSSMLWAFFYARLWRRTGLLTDVEFLELRYSGKPAAFLRGFKAAYSAIFVNCIVMGWVILAMTKISTVALGLTDIGMVRLPVVGMELAPDMLITVSLIMLALIYSVLSGMWGVVITDLIQFVMAMFGSIMLAVIAVRHIGGIGKLQPMLEASSAASPSILRFAPEPGAGQLALITFGVYFGVQWWAFRNADGGEYIGLRAMACRDDRHARLAILWFTFAHYVLRPWPWIVVALVSILVYPNLADPEMGYPKMMIDFLPVGLRGLMVASLLAAFMSTIDTHLHWGASYLSNDIYKRFIKPGAGEKHYVLAARVAMIFMAALAVGTSSAMSSIEWAWKFLVAIGAGVGLVYLLRWYWWRINAWSEISAMTCSLGTAVILFSTRLGTREYEGVRLLLIVVISTVVWLIVTFLTAPAPEETLRRFYERIRPGGPGWGPIERKFNLTSTHRGGRDILGALSGAAFVYTSLFALGKLVLGYPFSIWIPLSGIALMSGGLMLWCLKE